jgi:uncharacterized protein
MNTGAFRRQGAALLILLVGLLAVTTSRAAQVERLFEAVAPVANQQPDERDRAIQVAFRALLAKLTGDGGVAARGDLAPLFAQAPRLVQQYGYRYLSPTPDMPSAAPRQVLTVVFDEEAVAGALAAHGLPLWGANRPAVLLWGLVEQGGRGDFFSPDVHHAINAGLVEGAGERGMALFFPLLDLEDLTRLQPEDLTNQAAVGEASQRYGVDVTATVRFVEQGGGWEGQWTLDDPRHGRGEWRAPGESPRAAALAGLRALADHLGRHYAPASAAVDQGPSWVRLHVSGVADLVGYARVMGLLSRLSAIEGLTLREVRGDTLLLELEARGGVAGVEREVALGGVFERDVHTPPSEQAQADLTLRLRR